MEERVRLILFKGTEMVFFMLSTILFLSAMKDDEPLKDYCIITGIGAYFCIILILVVAYSASKPPDPLLNLLMCLVWSGYGGIAGGLLLDKFVSQKWDMKDKIKGLVCAGFSLTYSLLCLIEGITIYIKSPDWD